MIFVAGVWGKILEINLTAQSIKEVEVPEKYYRDYVGGAGLGARLFFDRMDPKRDALDPESPLIVLTGPFTGTRISGAVTRFDVVARSPLTGIWGESSCGGTLGVMLKRCGVDGLLFTGKAAKPTYLHLFDGKAELRDATALWGKDTYEINEVMGAAFKEETGKAPTVFSIGPAGENLVKYAAIMNDAKNAAGRCGMGAVMGSKNLKAVVCWGNQKVKFADDAALDELRKMHMEKLKASLPVESISQFGTDGGMDLGNMTGDVPVRNWAQGVWDEGIEKLNGPTMAETILTKRHACFGCSVGCKRVVKVDEEPWVVPEGAGPEYETVCTFGTMMLIDNLAFVSKANELCNKMGLDTITCGVTITYLMEAQEKGLMKPAECDGIEVKFGDPANVLELVRKISHREGIGGLLAEGSRAMAKKLGPAGENFAADVKGLEAPMHDGRAFHGMALNYAVGVRGACHVNTFGMMIEHGFCFFPEWGLADEQMAQTGEGKALVHVVGQDLGGLMNSLCICHFPAIPLSEEDYLNMLNASTGFGYTLETMMDAGARMWMLRRGIDNLYGITSADDKLPPRLLVSLEDGNAAGSVPDVPAMLEDFYKLRGIDPDGKPSKAALEKLGLGDLAAKLHG